MTHSKNPDPKHNVVLVKIDGGACPPFYIKAVL